jgi:formate hydrogenlyase subunit 6/NADH:ubiquinone oxidoreductase subunit I
MALFKIAGTIIKSLFSKPATLMYPLKPAKRTKISKGHVVNDITKCIFCGSCQRACPTQAICVVRDAGTWEIDRLRCCTCNACVETCPVKCLSMDPAYTPPLTTARCKDLLKGTPPAKPAPKPPAEKKDGGTSAAA